MIIINIKKSDVIARLKNFLILAIGVGLIGIIIGGISIWLTANNLLQP